MMRIARSLLLLSLAVGGLVVAQGDESTETPAAAAPRAVEAPTFSFEDLARWILGSQPDVEDRPVSIALAFDRTDSVWGTGAEKDVLPTVWRRDLLGSLLQSFLVRGRPEEGIQGDRVSLFGFGRRALTTIALDRPFRPEVANDLKQAYPEPYVDTPEDQSGTFLADHLDEVIEEVEGLYSNDNVLVVLVTDDIVQGDDSRGPRQARAFRTYRAQLQEGGTRVFTVYLYWNDFPNTTRFTAYDPEANSDVIETRLDRAAEQAAGRPPRLEGTTSVPSAADTERPLEPSSGPDTRWILWLAVAAVAVALLAFVLRTWMTERYEVRDEQGLIDRSIPVFPGRSKRVAVPDPAQPSEPIGHLVVAPKLPFGFSRLRLAPAKGYTVALEGRRTAGTDGQPKRSSKRGSTRQNAKKRGANAKKPIVLAASRRKPEKNVVTYRLGDRANPAHDAEQVSGDAAITTPDEAQRISLSVTRATGGAKRRTRKRGAGSAEPNRSASSRRSRRRVDLSERTEGEEP